MISRTSVAALVAMVLFPAAVAMAATETMIHNFNPSAGCAGAYPGAALIFGPDGSLYGTASGGGCARAAHCGTMFQLVPPASGQTNWTFTPVFEFCGDQVPPQGQPCLQGAWPQVAVITDRAADNSGSFDTTTWVGGQTIMA